MGKRLSKIITRTGAWFRYGEEQLGQGRDKVRVYLKDHPQFVQELTEKILAGGGYTAPLAGSEDAEAEEVAAEE